MLAGFYFYFGREFICSHRGTCGRGPFRITPTNFSTCAPGDCHWAWAGGMTRTYHEAIHARCNTNVSTETLV